MQETQRKTTGKEHILGNSFLVIMETIDCVESSHILLRIPETQRTELDKLFLRLSIERIITNTHQLASIYRKHTGLELSSEEDNSLKRIKTVRDGRHLL